MTATMKPRRAGKKKQHRALSRLQKPAEMTLDDWQIGLRREFGRAQKFRIKNRGDEPIFSEFEVTNPESGRSYRVAIRGQALGENFCSCPDFAVNTLGTCKHIEFLLGKLARRAGAKAALALGYRPAFSEVYLQYGAQRQVVFRAGTECPEPLKAFARRFFDEQNRLTPEAFARFHEFLQRASSNGHKFHCYEDALEYVAQVRDQANLVERVAAAFSRGIHAKEFAKLLKVPLFAYQREGALFAAKAGRSLIADDMGLGKTIQAIAAVEILAKIVGVERVLVVSPTSLKHQWQQEIEKFTDRSALVVEGLLGRRAELYATPSFYKLTNYDVIARDLERIRQWQPDVVILDEAQRIKNWKTRTAQSVKRLESKYAVVLTGTPLENRIEELHSIVEFVDRFRLGPMFRFLDEHQHVDEAGRVVGYRNLSKISETLRSILIRRTKDKVLKELPERMEKRFFVPMTKEQMEYHEENRETVARIVHKWRKYKFLTEADQLRMRIALQNMRMSCNSTYLLDKKTDHGRKADEMIDLLAEVFEDRQAKVVVFSQWVRMHELVVRRLEQRKWGHVFFHGGVPGPERKGLIHRFKEDPNCRLFLSTDAGGVGLNLQNAAAVVNLDQPWNPAVLEQRIGRVHRLGQHRPVRVVHFIAQGTIEEGMLGLLAFKKSVFAGVLDDGQSEVFLGGSRLKRFMESVERAADSIPPSMPQQSEATVGAAGEFGDGSDGTDRTDRTNRTDGAMQSTGSPGRAAAPAQPDWAELLAAGASFLEKLGKTIASTEPRASGGPPVGLVARDEQSGQSYLKLPLPDEGTVQKIVDLLSVFTGRR
jgi:superfamily II DNA or RNA helicase